MTNEQIATDIATIKITLLTMQTQLLGNGQPGRIQKLETKVEKLESFSDKVRGAGVVVGSLFTVLGTVLWKHLTGR